MAGSIEKVPHHFHFRCTFRALCERFTDFCDFVPTHAAIAILWAKAPPSASEKGERWNRMAWPGP